jgi:hypothetical protein
MTEDPRQAVLGTINLIRDRVGAPELASLPVGVMCDPGECAIQRGLRSVAQGIEVWKKNMVVPDELVPVLEDAWGRSKVTRHRSYQGYSRVRMPAWFHEFIAGFDAGEYPDLSVPFGTQLPFSETTVVPDTVPEAWSKELEPACV